jgi:hypothetical protein
MTTSLPPKTPTIYPTHTYRLSPTFSRWVPLRARDVHALTTHSTFDAGHELFYYSNHPIKWVRVTGVIVAIDDFSTRRIYTLDDGSGGVVECVCPGPPNPNSYQNASVAQLGNGRIAAMKGNESRLERKGQSAEDKGKDKVEEAQPSVKKPQISYSDIDTGTILKVKGKPGVFRDVNQVEIIKAEIMRSTEQEVKCWAEVLAFRQQILDVPWALSQEEVERSRRKALKDGDRERKKREEKKRGSGEGSNRIYMESTEERRKRKDREHEERKRKRAREKEKEKEKEGLDPANKVNYPSLAVRRMVKGKYDALGI